MLRAVSINARSFTRASSRPRATVTHCSEVRSVSVSIVAWPRSCAARATVAEVAGHQPMRTARSLAAAAGAQYWDRLATPIGTLSFAVDDEVRVVEVRFDGDTRGGPLDPGRC